MARAQWSEGYEAAFALFSSLPDAARAEAKVLLDTLGQRILEIQQSLAPVDTGKLRAGLTVDQALGVLRERIGFPKVAGKGNPFFYAIFQEYGRRAQSVAVRRRKPGTARKGRSKGGAAAGTVETYTMRVRATPARPFVHIEDRVSGLVDQMTADFWQRTLARAGAE